MHNCREVRERLTELILDGQPDRELVAELNKCAECRAEFDAVNATLRTTTRVRETAIPAESYWPAYHARLRDKLSHVQVRRRKENTGASFAPLRLCVNILFRPVPVPLAAALVVLALLGLLAFRGTRKPAAPQSVVVHVPVEIPVVQEKLVTQVVYRNRYLPSRTSKRTGADSRVENTFAKSQMPRPDDVPTLTGFKPAADVKLTVIKGGSPNEK